MWKRNRGSSSKTAQHLMTAAAPTLIASSPRISHHAQVATSSRKASVILLPICSLLLLLVSFGRWKTSIESPPVDTVAGTSQQAVQSTESLSPPVQRQVRAKLRFDWTNMKVTSDMAKRIVAHQTDCSLPLVPEKQLLPYGLGSSLHSWGTNLCVAMGQGGRTWTTMPWIWLDEERCFKNDSPIKCYFPSTELVCPNDVSTQPKISTGFMRGCIDHVLGNYSQESWSVLRAAATEYMFRNVSGIVIEEAERQLQLVFPEGVVPPKLITIHIRWGDKILGEMKKVSIQEYIHGVNSILKTRNETNPQDVNIFLATEDPNAVREFKDAAPKEWKIYVDQYFHDMISYRGEKVFGQNNNMNANQTKGRAGLVALGSLLVAVEANDFVLTTRSNWSRLMNELRKNVLDPRCNGCTNMVDLRYGED